ncbi:Eco57I restriction-modification methylase domain-containing protein [Micromonospora chalcea]
MGVVMKATPDSNKLRGGYYTPQIVADWLAAWAAPLGTERVLEPSAGDGQLLRGLKKAAPNSHVVALEFDPAEAKKCREVLAGMQGEVHVGDAFAWFGRKDNSGKFDAVLGNPPFIRFQHFSETVREAAFALMKAEGLKPSRLTNAWLPFVVLSTVALREGGRLALVLPAELLQVGYAADLRSYLSRKYADLTIVTFQQLIFPGILQETVLLMGIRKDCESARISVKDVSDGSALEGLRLPSSSEEGIQLDHASEKWTKYFLTPQQIGLLREIPSIANVSSVGALASVDVGIVTGRNEFFVLSQSQAAKHGVEGDCHRMIGRSAQIPGLLLSGDEWQALRNADSKVLLFNPGKVQREALSPQARTYVESGEAAEYDTGYKCRIRRPNWWAVPSAWTPDAFLLRQIYDGPRFILNDAQVTCTDTIHRVRMLDGSDASKLCARSLNSMTWAFSEVRGRSYGGGVLELEPREAETLPVPVVGEFELQELDQIRRNKGSLAVLDAVDAVVMPALGLTKRDQEILRSAWQTLSQRRSARKATK